jgi:hypothetical protein
MCLPRRRVVANLAASYLTASLKRAGRRAFGKRLAEIEIAAQIYREQLGRSLRG